MNKVFKWEVGEDKRNFTVKISLEKSDEAKVFLSERELLDTLHATILGMYDWMLTHRHLFNGIFGNITEAFYEILNLHIKSSSVLENTTCDNQLTNKSVKELRAALDEMMDVCHIFDMLVNAELRQLKNPNVEIHIHYARFEEYLDTLNVYIGAIVDTIDTLFKEIEW